MSLPHISFSVEAVFVFIHGLLTEAQPHLVIKVRFLQQFTQCASARCAGQCLFLILVKVVLMVVLAAAVWSSFQLFPVNQLFFHMARARRVA